MADVHVNGTLLRKVKASELKVDHTYQRGLDEKRAKRIGDSYDPEMLGIIVVSEREDGLYIVDGQHRHGGLMSAGKGDEWIAVDVRRGLTVTQEANLFYRLNGPNGQSPVKAYFKYRARVVAEEPVAIEVSGIVSSLGLRVTESACKRGVAAISTVMNVHTRCGNLRQVLAVLLSLSRMYDHDKDAYDRRLIHSVAWFLSDFPRADSATLVSKLQASAKRTGPNGIIDVLEHDRRSFRDEEQRHCYVNTMLSIYNKRNPKPLRREDRLDEDA